VPWRAGDAPGWEHVSAKRLLDPARGGARELVVDLLELPAGAGMPPLAHAQAAVDYVLAGRARVVLDGGPAVTLAPGACLYHPAGAAHAVQALGDAPVRWVRTFACERRPPPVRPLAGPLAGAPPGAAAPAAAPAVGRVEAPAWRAVEPVKGLKIRVKRLLDRGVEMMAGVCELDPGVHYTRHWHDQPEIYVVLAGAGVVYRGDEELEVGAGTALHLASREVHGLDSLAAAPLRLFWVYGCETAGDTINWTPVEPIYERARRAGAPGSGGPAGAPA
jgi:quercetin dioxygenase-like cupin family protein